MTIETPMPEQSEIADFLIAQGKLDALGLERAVRVAEETGERVELLLTKLGQVSEKDMAAALSETLDILIAEPDDYPPEPVLTEMFSPRFLKEYRIIPIEDAGDAIALIMADPLDGYAIDAVRLLTNKQVNIRIGVPAEIEAAYTRLYEHQEAPDDLVADSDSDIDDGMQSDVERLRDLASEAPVIRLVNSIISRAVDMQASDIHIEPFEHKLEVRYRIDGILRRQQAPPFKLRAPLISRIKLMAKLNIAETRLPQDGRIKLAIRGKEIDMRVSTVPTLYGEAAVLRVLDRSTTVLDFESIGFKANQLETYRGVLESSHGILLVTGPTGSGKTTTLYTSLNHLNNGDRKILTVEDPVEYQIDGINQVQVKSQIGLNFATALRSFLRQDPDVIMVGEIRDRETAQIAVQAALTGHTVLSTLHTNNAASAVTRLLDMGVEDYLLTSTVIGVLAQRLVRLLCAECREPYEASQELIDECKLETPSNGMKPEFYRAVGCASCGQTGYKGRTTILELLVMSDGIRRRIVAGDDANAIQQEAIKEGMAPMFADGVRKSLSGATSLEEVMRVTRES